MDESKPVDTGKGPRSAWVDCPTCRGKDGKRWGEVDVRERCQACNGQGFTAGVLYGFDEEARTECPRCHWQGSIIVRTIPCPTCAAFWLAVDSAREAGARDALKALVEIAIPIPPADAEKRHPSDPWCEGFREGRFAYRDAIRAAIRSTGDRAKGGTRNG